MRRTLSQRKYDHYSRLRNRLEGLYRQHIQFKSTHGELLADLDRYVYQDKWYKRLTGAQRFGLSEVSHCWLDRIHQTMVDWRLGPASGPTRTALETWTPEMSELCRIPGALYGAHYWKQSDRLFSDGYKPIN